MKQPPTIHYGLLILDPAREGGMIETSKTKKQDKQQRNPAREDGMIETTVNVILHRETYRPSQQGLG